MTKGHWLISLEISQCRAELRRLAARLQAYEQQYGTASAEFFRSYYSGWPHFSTTKARRHKENLVKHYPALAHNPRNLVTWCLCG